MKTSALITSLSRLQTVKYINVASLTLFIYDNILTFDLELTLIWSSKWGTGKILFLLARYSTFVDVPLLLYYSMNPDIPVHLCLPIFDVVTLFSTFGIAMAEAILVLQTYALWSRSSRFKIFLTVEYMVIHVPAIVITAIFLRNVRYDPHPSPMIVGCYAITMDKIAIGDFLLLMLHEIIILALTLWIGIKNHRHSRSLFVTNLLRNGIFYFFGIFLISAGNVVTLVAGPREFYRLLTTIQRVVHSVLSTRILLHVRQATLPREQLTTLSAIRFQSITDTQISRDTIGGPSDTTIPPHSAAHTPPQVNQPRPSSA